MWSSLCAVCEAFHGAVKNLKFVFTAYEHRENEAKRLQKFNQQKRTQACSRMTVSIQYFYCIQLIFSSECLMFPHNYWLFNCCFYWRLTQVLCLSCALTAAKKHSELTNKPQNGIRWIVGARVIYSTDKNRCTQFAYEIHINSDLIRCATVAVNFLFLTGLVAGLLSMTADRWLHVEL